ncbi:MAG: type VI secretion system baseplate subunit TssG, partial [Bryobacteraceae bacterium]
MAPESRTDDLTVDGLDAEVLSPEAAEALALSPSRYAAVEELLRKTPQEFRFFQAVRLFERLNPERSPIGRFVQPTREVVRFASHNSFPFPASQIQEVIWPLRPGDPAPGRRAMTPIHVPVIVVNFMGLTGPSGILPLYYTEMIVERIRNRDRTLANFFDIFNHRMISLFYQAWEKYRFSIAYERGERDRFSHHLMDLIGLGTPKLERRLARRDDGRPAVEDDSLLFYSGLLSLHPRSATALRQILWDYFDVPVRIEQFVGGWHRLDRATQCEFDRGQSISEQL